MVFPVSRSQGPEHLSNNDSTHVYSWASEKKKKTKPAFLDILQIVNPKFSNPVFPPLSPILKLIDLRRQAEGKLLAF